MQGGKHFSQNARDELGRDGAASVIPGGGEDGKSFIAPAFTKTYDMEAKVGSVPSFSVLPSGSRCGTVALPACEGGHTSNACGCAFRIGELSTRVAGFSMHPRKRHLVASGAYHLLFSYLHRPPRRRPSSGSGACLSGRTSAARAPASSAGRSCSSTWRR